MPFYVFAAAMTLISILLWGYWFTWTICCIFEIELAPERDTPQSE